MSIRVPRLVALAFALMSIARCTGGTGDGPDGGSAGGGGFELAVAAPSTVKDLRNFGGHVSMVLDADGAPLVAYVVEDENADTQYDDTRLYFVRWDSAAQKWGSPTAVVQLGQIDSNHPLRQVSLARDPVTGRLGIAYTVGYYQIGLALSNDGVTWTTHVIQAKDDTDTVGNPALALRDGVIHLAYYKEWERCTAGFCAAGVYRTGTDPLALSRELLPLLTDTSANRNTPIGLAVDSSGKPALAYYLRAASSDAPETYNVSLAYWRPGSASAVKVTDSQNRQNDTPSLALAFHGDKPRIAFHLQRPDDTDTSPILWFTGSDDGQTFSQPIRLPQDGKDVTSWYQSIAVGSNGETAIAAFFSASHSGTAGACDGPKIVRSAGSGSFTICGADPDGKFGFGGYYVQAAFRPDGKLVLAFQLPRKDAPIGPGVVVWREP